MKQTQQRNIIMETVNRSKRPLTVTEIHNEAKKTIIGLGMATVYRTLSIMLNAGDVRKLVFSDQQLRYEMSGREHHHHHHQLLCRICGKSFIIDCLANEISKSALPNNFIVETCELTFRGTCGECTANNNDEVKP